MRYYPINLDIRNKDCLVVGAGDVGERKVDGLLRSGANVSVVGQEATPRLREMEAKGIISLHLRPYTSSDINGKFLVIGATDDEQVNKKISQDAHASGIVCNIADRPESCSFVLPAVFQQGDLVVAVSTSNKSPALAKRIRKKLENEFGPEYDLLLKLMGSIRKKILAMGESPEAQKGKFEQLLDRDLLGLIKQGQTDKIDGHLKEVMGEGYTWTGLMEPVKIGESIRSVEKGDASPMMIASSKDDV